MSRLYFQTLTEPILSPSEAPSLEKFHPVVSEGRMWATAGIIAAIVAGSFFSGPTAQAIATDFQESRSIYGVRAFHYQAVATPPLPTPTGGAPPVIPIDRRTAKFPDQFDQKKIVLPAIQAGSFFFVRHIPVMEYIYLDKWQPDYPDFIKVEKNVRAVDQYLGTLSDEPRAEFIGPDKFVPILPDFYYEKQYLNKSIISGSQFQCLPSVIETITIDEWLPSYPSQLLPIKGYLFTENYFSFENAAFVLLEATLDSWLPSYPDQVYLNNFIQTDIFTFVKEPDPETIITCDKWVPNYPSILLVKDWLQQQIQSGSFFIGDIPREEIVDLSKILINQAQYFYKNEFLPDSIQSGSFFMGDIPRLTTEFRIHVWQRIA